MSETTSEILLRIADHSQLAIDRQQRQIERKIERGATTETIEALERGDRELRLIRRYVMNEIADRVQS